MGETVQEHPAIPAAEELTDARRRLFEAALRAFGERGYHAVSVKDLMTTLGQQPGALYFHVASKQDLLFELVRIGTDHHQAVLRRALLDAGSDPVDQVRAIVGAHVRVHLEFRDLARVTTGELRSLDEDQQAQMLVVRQETARLLEDVIDRGLELGAFRVASRDLAVTAIGSMGVATAQWWEPDGPHTIDDVAGAYADYAVQLLS